MRDAGCEISATYASCGPTGAFDDHANERHMLLTPFAVPSWEPRFAMDCMARDAALLLRGLEIFLLVQDLESSHKTFSVHAASKSRVVLFKTDNSFSRSPSWQLVQASATPVEAAQFLSQWLCDGAEYPPQPWFDGGEAQGFQMFGVPYKGHPREFYNGLIVEPKWFEVHK